MSNSNLNLTRTSLDTIAIFVPSNLSLSQTPLILSNAVGLTDFITFEKQKDNVKLLPTMNGNVIESVSNTLVSGSMTFQPQSVALIGIRDILEAQLVNKKTIRGTLSLTNPSALIQNVYRNFCFTSVITGSSVGRSLSDVEVRFTCLPPQTITVGGAIAIGGAISRTIF